ncbi:4Fe-4S binding protein [Lacrimispora sp. 38-1]|uniref:4Fe-4S binding protein n=1 Tax=Lacrimispora sp. 38-1 TaxID=3125778 RepID=UPI003CF7EC44
MKKNNFIRGLRIIILLGLLAYVTYGGYMHQVLGGGKAPSVHALCPFGALESLYTLLFMGSFIQKIYSGTVVLLLLTVIMAILFGRSFCGLLCPFGALQELFGRIGRKILKKHFIMPAYIDRPLRYLKYFILLLTTGMAWHYGALWMAPYDPYSAYAHVSVFSESIKEDPLAVIGFLLLIVTVAGSFIYDRFFCKYLCPVGAFYGIVRKISPTRIERNADLCINCKKCNKVCPVNIEVEKSEKINSAECINCNECVLVCPKEGALEIRTAGKKIQPFTFLLIVVGVFFGTILVASLTGNFQIMPSKLEEGQVITISEIKGYYTIEEAAIATGLSLQEIYEILGIPENISKNTQMKQISNEVESFDLDEAKLKASGDASVVNETVMPDVSDSSDQVDISGIKGSMTIQEASDSMKMEIEEFYILFKIPESVPEQTRMKDIEIVSPGYDFESIKESLR